MDNKRKIAAGLLGGAALLMLICVVAKIWWSGDGISVGPFGAEGRGRSISLSKLDSTWGTMGMFVGIFGIVGALVCAGAAAAAGMGKVVGSGPMSLSKNAMGMGASFLMFSIIFLATLPGRAKGISMGAGFPLALVGGGLAIAGGLMLMQWEKSPEGQAAKAGAPTGAPGYPGLPAGGAPPMGAPMAMGGPPPPAAAPSTPCTRCGAPARWIAEHNRWFCDREQQYL